VLVSDSDWDGGDGFFIFVILIEEVEAFGVSFDSSLDLLSIFDILFFMSTVIWDTTWSNFVLDHPSRKRLKMKSC
jgi:hypothetical protein